MRMSGKEGFGDILRGVRRGRCHHHEWRGENGERVELSKWVRMGGLGPAPITNYLIDVGF